MSWTDTILSNTIGVAYRAYTGNVDPWTLQQTKDDTAAAIATASGPDADPGDVAIAQAQANADIDNNLLSEGAHPSQSTALPRIHIPLLGDLTDTASYLKAAEHLVYALLAIGAVAGTGYLWLKHRKAIKAAFQQ